MKMIHFLDKLKADSLVSLGFQYKEETIGEKQFYSFVDTPELRKLLNSNFSEKDFFVSKYMNF